MNPISHRVVKYATSAFAGGLMGWLIGGTVPTWALCLVALALGIVWGTVFDAVVPKRSYR